MFLCSEHLRSATVHDSLNYLHTQQGRHCKEHGVLALRAFTVGHGGEDGCTADLKYTMTHSRLPSFSVTRETWKMSLGSSTDGGEQGRWGGGLVFPGE